MTYTSQCIGCFERTVENSKLGESSLCCYRLKKYFDCTCVVFASVEVE